MKKILLLSLGFLPAVLFAQNRANYSTVKQSTTHSVKESMKPTQDVSNPTSAKSKSKAASVASTVGKVIGKSYYDLQSNAAAQRRIVRYPGNITSATWTFSPDSTDDTHPHRGAGYNHFNGTAWGPLPIARVEASTRTGWPALCTNASGQDVVISHKFASSTYGNWMLRNTTAGGTFTETAVTTNTTNIWTRTANSGNHIYMLDASQDTNTVVVGAATKQPVLLSISTDGGTTWATSHILIPSFPYSRYYRCGGDDYFIDAKDSIVAIVVGGSGRDVTVMKSTDWGVTFTSMVADAFPIAAYHGGATGTITDSIQTNDGNVTCLIDNNGMVHAWWGTYWLKGDPNSSTSWSYYPNLSSALAYWNEDGMQSRIIDRLVTDSLFQDGRHDCDGNGRLIVGTGYDLTGSTSKDAKYRSGMMSMPQAAIDAVGNIFVAYSCLMENDTTGVDNINSSPQGQNYRDILMMYLKTDASSHYDSAFASYASGNNTWSRVINVTKSPGFEDVYPSLARGVDTAIYMVWQEDIEPGTNLTNGDDISNNFIKYLEINTNNFISNATTDDACATNLVQAPLAKIGASGAGCTYTFSDLSTGNPISWNWAFADNTGISTVQNPTHTYNKGGTFKVTLDVWNTAGTSHAYKSITVDAAGCVNAVNDVVNNYNISIFPNPSTGLINITFNEMNVNNASISIENMLGQQVAKLDNQTITNDTKVSFNLATQANGVYFIKFQSANKNFTQKFVIEK